MSDVIAISNLRELLHIVTSLLTILFVVEILYGILNLLSKKNILLQNVWEYIAICRTSVLIVTTIVVINSATEILGLIY